MRSHEEPVTLLPTVACRLCYILALAVVECETDSHMQLDYFLVNQKSRTIVCSC
jgi:hypothetical protein